MLSERREFMRSVIAAIYDYEMEFHGDINSIILIVF